MDGDKRTIELEILGEPMGKQRPRVAKIGGFARAYTPKETVNYESMVVDAFKKSGQEPFKVGQQLRCQITAYFQIPKACYRFHKKTNTTDLTLEGEKMLKGDLRPIKKPDCDNIGKIILDALNGIAFHDDSQIVTLEVYKYYSERPKVYVDIWEVE